MGNGTPSRVQGPAAAVTCDWARFQRFARTGLARYDEDGDLALVRCRPFTGIDPQRYAWTEPIVQEMVSAVVDVAYELATRRREAHDIPGALWAAKRGLLAAEESEMLHRQIFLAPTTPPTTSTPCAKPRPASPASTNSSSAASAWKPKLPNSYVTCYPAPLPAPAESWTRHRPGKQRPKCV